MKCSVRQGESIIWLPSRTFWSYPDRPFDYFNSYDVSELHKIRRLTDFEALKIVKGSVGYIATSTVACEMFNQIGRDSFWKQTKCNVFWELLEFVESLVGSFQIKFSMHQPTKSWPQIQLKGEAAAAHLGVLAGKLLDSWLGKFFSFSKLGPWKFLPPSQPWKQAPLSSDPTQFEDLKTRM